MIKILIVGFMLLACYLLLRVFANICKIGILGAIIGAIVCIFVPYKLETCLIWGFCIGMVLQFITSWKKMLVEAICAAVGFGIAYLVNLALTYFGVPFEISSPISILILVGFCCLGSSEAADSVSNAFDFSSGSNHIHINYTSEPKEKDPDPWELKEQRRVRYTAYEERRCETCRHYLPGHCGYHNIEVDYNDGCNHHS